MNLNSLLKLGALGVRVSDGKDNLHIPGHSVKCIDATGTRNTFYGVILTEWLRSDDPFNSATYAKAAETLSTTNCGTVDSYPNRDSVTQFLGFSI